MLKKEIIISILIILLYTFSCNIIYNQTNKEIIINKENKKLIDNKNISDPTLNNLINNIEITTNENYIGKLIINKIKINNNLYKINSKENNIEKNITILKESIEPTYQNSIMFIAAHSGTGSIAYFKNLSNLEKNDEIKLIYDNKTYIYYVNKKYEQLKDGYIKISKQNNKAIILTTCSTNDNKQLIVECIEKESI